MPNNLLLQNIQFACFNIKPTVFLNVNVLNYVLFQLKERLNALENGNNTQQFQTNNKYNTNNSHRNSEYQLNNITDKNMTQELIDDENETDVTLIASDINNSDVVILDINARHDFNNINDEKHIINQCDTSINNSKYHLNQTYITLQQLSNSLLIDFVL